MKKNFRWALIFLASVLVVLIVVSGIIFLSDEKIPPNISIGGMDVGRLTQEEAIAKLRENFFENIKDIYIPLTYEDKVWKLKYTDINFSYDFEKAVDEAYNMGRAGNIVKRYFDALHIRIGKKDIPIKFYYEKDNILKVLDGIAKEINKEAINASIRLKAEGFVITPEKQGVKLDNNKAAEIIAKRVENYDISKVELPVDIIEAEIKKSELANINEKLGEYSTKFNANNTSRSYNIKLATKSVTDVLVPPGQVFSLNKTIGPRLEKYGYKTAKVIINNEYVDGIGGGICQVSTTLYNAALLSNMKIVERKNHSMPSDYVSLGRDATISGDYIDMKFENNGKYPIYIYGEVKGNQVKFSIYGKEEYPKRSVKIKTEVVKKIEPQIKIIQDKSLPVGTEIIEKKPKTGYVVKSYRVIMENGKEVFMEPLFTDTYRVSDGVKRVGTKPVEIVEQTNTSE